MAPLELLMSSEGERRREKGAETKGRMNVELASKYP